MSENDRKLALFNLCKSLVELLGEEQAIADLTLLYKRHPEMFKNENEVKEVIEKVVSEPDIIVKNPTPFSEKDYIVGKKLDDEKMGEVGIRKDENITKIFHANEKNIKKLKQLDKKEVVYKKPMVGAPTSYTQAQSLDERLVENNISSAYDKTIPNTPQKSQILSEQETLIDKILKTQDELNSMPRAKDFTKDFEKDLEQSFNVKLDDEDLKKDEGNKFKTRLKKQ